MAYYPYTPSFQHVVDTVLNFDYKEGLYGWMWSPGRTGMCMHPTPRNGMYLYYKVPEKVENQVDLMATYVPNQSGGYVPLTMKHLLTAIRFKTGKDMPECTVKKIALSDVRSSGYMNVMSLVNVNDKTLWWEKPEQGEDEDEFTADLKKNASQLTSYSFEPNTTVKPGEIISLSDKHDENDQLLANDNTMLLLPQELEKASLYVEIEYTIDGTPYTMVYSIDLKGEWKPGVTVTYTLNSKVPQIPIADLRLLDEYGAPLNEISVGYVGGETNYKVASYLNYTDDNGGNLKRLPMPWKASIVQLDYENLDENGNPKETPIIEYEFRANELGVVSSVKEMKNQDAYDEQFGSIKRIEFDYYNENIPSSLEAMADIPVKTFVMIPKIKMKNTSSATKYLREDAPVVGDSLAPFNLASRGIGLVEKGLKIFHKNGQGVSSSNDWTDFLAREYKYTNDSYGDEDINTANCYIVSAPGWYTIPLVYGNAVKDKCVNYSAYVFKPNNHGVSSTSTAESLNGKNQILRYAIRHDGNPIQSPYILDGNDIKCDSTDRVVAELLWEDQICLIEDISLVDAGTQTLDEFYSLPPNQRYIQKTYEPKKKIRFHIQKDNIRQGNAVIVLRKATNTFDEHGNLVGTEKGDIIWSWHIWVTPDGTGTTSNYHPTSHISTIYGRLFKGEAERRKWTEIHNHYIYNRCIGLVMAGDELDFTPPNVYIKYEPLYEAMKNLLINKKARYTEDYGFTRMLPQTADAYIAKMRAYFKKNPVYVKVSQEGLNCKVEEDYYMLYQWGRKDPMISRFEHVYDGNHFRIDPADKRHLGEHSDITEHKEWIKYGIQHPDEFMMNGRITSGFFYANLWNMSLGTDEINSLYPADSNLTDFYRGDGFMGVSYILKDFYFTSDRVFKSVYDPSPVGQKMPVGPVLQMLATNTNMITKDAGQYTWYYYELAPYTGYGHTATGLGGLFTECKKDAEGNYITEPDYGSEHTFWIPAFGYRFGDGFTKQHGNEFVIWEGGPLNRAGQGHVLYGGSYHVKTYGENSHHGYTMALPVLPIFEEPQWLPSF